MQILNQIIFKKTTVKFVIKYESMFIKLVYLRNKKNE